LKKDRIVNYDAIRVLQSLFVICVHTALPLLVEDNVLLNNTITSFLFQCNGVFFMLSGYFNLSKEFSNSEDYKNFYLTRFMTIIIPYSVVSIIFVIIRCVQEHAVLNVKGYIWIIIDTIISANASSHLWFVCILIGFLISTPFLSKMLHSMKNDELLILFGVGMLWNVVTIYLTANVGLSFQISGWIFAGWPFVFVLGYICSRVVNDNNRKYFYIVGVIGFIISVLGRTYLDKFENATDLSPGYILFFVAMFLFYEKQLSVKNRIISGVISYLAKYSFLTYMLHTLVLQNVTKKLFEAQDSIPEYIASILFTFVVSYLLAIITSYIVVSPLQKIFRIFC